MFDSLMMSVFSSKYQNIFLFQPTERTYPIFKFALLGSNTNQRSVTSLLFDLESFLAPALGDDGAFGSCFLAGEAVLFFATSRDGADALSSSFTSGDGSHLLISWPFEKFQTLIDPSAPLVTNLLCDPSNHAAVILGNMPPKAN